MGPFDSVQAFVESFFQPIITDDPGRMLYAVYDKRPALLPAGGETFQDTTASEV
jgi:hypothetical protein